LVLASFIAFIAEHQTGDLFSPPLLRLDVSVSGFEIINLCFVLLCCFAAFGWEIYLFIFHFFYCALLFALNLFPDLILR
jgi:hypothetical protein